LAKEPVKPSVSNFSFIYRAEYDKWKEFLKSR